MNADLSELVGKTIVSIDEKHGELIFNCSTGERYKMYHSQDCCESVYIEDICGDLTDLIGTPILKAEEITNENFETALKANSKSEMKMITTRKMMKVIINPNLISGHFTKLPQLRDM